MSNESKPLRNEWTAAIRRTAVAGLCLLAAIATVFAQDAPVRITSDEAVRAVADKAQPVYPEMARKLKTGAVESVKTLSGNPLLTGAARKALLQWKFNPIKRNGKPVKATVAFSFNFS